MTLTNPTPCKVTVGTMTAALAAFGLAVLGHFVF